MESVATLTAYMAEISGGDSPRGSLSFKTLYAVGAVLFLITLLSIWPASGFQAALRKNTTDCYG